MGWVKGSDRNFEASQTERYRKTKKDRRERRETCVEATLSKPYFFDKGRGVLLVPFFFKTSHACTNWKGLEVDGLSGRGREVA